MKHFTQLLAILVFALLIVFISCKKGGGSDPDPLDVQADLLEAATWETSEISKNNNTEGIGDWSGFTMTFQYNDEEDIGQYTVNGIPPNDGAEDVFGATNGAGQNWVFENLTNTSILVRQTDGIRMNISIVENTSLTITFNIAESGNRVAGFDGDWEFVLTPQ